MTQTIEKPRVGNVGTGLDGNWQVIVLDDNHNTYGSVASALAQVIPGCSYARGWEHATEVDRTGQSLVWTGMREVAELYWEQLNDFGLTMAPLDQM